MISILPLKSRTIPVRREKKLKAGIKVYFTYYNNFEEHIVGKLNPSLEEEKSMYEEAKNLCYKFNEIIEIDSNNITPYIEKYFRIVEKKFDYDLIKLPIPPYILGIWLGDGHSATLSLTNIDKCIIEEWCNYGKKNNLYIRKSIEKERKTDTKDYETEFVASYFITSTTDRKIKNTILDEFKKLNLINNKHIPEIYLKNSQENRLELLAGLIDTDGSIARQAYEITQKNKNLAEHIVILAKSLGFSTLMKTSIKHCTNSLNKEHKGTYYRIRISLNQITPIIPVKCERKKQPENFKYTVNYKIKSVDNALNTPRIIWTEELKRELMKTVLSFQKIEPNQQIPWTRLHEFNDKLPKNKGESMRTQYRILKTDTKYLNLDIIVFNPVEIEWMNNYNDIKNLLTNEQSDKTLSDRLHNWYHSQKQYEKNENFYCTKSKFLEELKSLQSKSIRSQILPILENIRNDIKNRIENKHGIILLKNEKLYIPSHCEYNNVKIGHIITTLKSLLQSDSKKIVFDIYENKKDIENAFNSILDDSHLNKAECRKNMIIQLDEKKNIIKEHKSCESAAEYLVLNKEIKSIESGKRLISSACKSNNICYKYYWSNWLEYYTYI
jgi:hypothetical protein